MHRAIGAGPFTDAIRAFFNSFNGVLKKFLAIGTGELIPFVVIPAIQLYHGRTCFFLTIQPGICFHWNIFLVLFKKSKCENFPIFLNQLCKGFTVIDDLNSQFC